MKELEERQKRYTKMLVLVHNLERHYGSMTRVPDNNADLKKLRKLANLKAYEDHEEKKGASLSIDRESALKPGAFYVESGTVAIKQVEQPVGKVVA